MGEVASGDSHRAGTAAAWMLLAGLMFAFMDAGMKWIANSYSPFQVATLRSVAAMPPVLLWILLRGRAHTLRHVHWPLHLLRGVLGVGVMAGFVYGVARMPLSTAYAIVFVAPLMVTALAVPLLGEKVGPRRWAAIVVGLLGVLVVLRPGMTDVATGPGLVLVGAALSYAVAAITVRKLAQRDSPEAMVFWFLVLLAVFAGGIAAFDWQPVQRPHLWIVAAIGLTGALGQVALTHAFRLGEASQRIVLSKHRLCRDQTQCPRESPPPALLPTGQEPRVRPLCESSHRFCTARAPVTARTDVGAWPCPARR